jgi:drug/metabolite transporter (DMT)-like permease
MYLALHVVIALYSLAGVCSKMAAGEQFASFSFFAWYAGVLVILFIYAVVWQQVLRRLTLTTAFANKGVTLVWGMLWGALIFAEHISIWMIMGAAVVFAGIILVVSSDE